MRPCRKLLFPKMRFFADLNSVLVALVLFVSIALSDALSVSSQDFEQPVSAWLDSTGSSLFVADVALGSISRIDVEHLQTADSGLFTASFRTPYGITGDGSGNLYIADTGNNRIVRMDLSSGIM